MYQVTVETYSKKGKELIDQLTVALDDFDTGVRQLEDLLYGLEVEYDDIEGDGDMIVDDMVMCASEEEEFIEVLEGNKYIYKIIGSDL